MAFGGSSFGAIAALVEGMRGGGGCGFGALLVESPSLWIGDPEPETFLRVSGWNTVTVVGLDVNLGKEGRSAAGREPQPVVRAA
jgi:enterochelin esterase-like enzyme